MSQYFVIHPERAQARLIQRAVEIVGQGGLIAYPTDSCYALGCHIGDKRAMQRIRRIRQLDEKHHFTLVCRDLSELSNYALVDNSAYRLMKRCTPGPYTFLLKATHEVPRRLLAPKRRTIGLRVPAHPVALQICEALGGPLMSSSLILPDDPEPLSDPQAMRELLEHDVDLVIDSGYCGVEVTTVIDLTRESPAVLRQGKGDTDWLSRT
ncbi:MAG: L-threonylcarbamoyladenylate synthase [Gammaproteobacteria bacterium]|nr:L-threonylcarbamoyladenylate synthase [Gammaproteobacteria bacterium]